ncbi:hypothetical protein [Halomonas campaniensis]|uniref:Uncharacterized protein n=1 Tax=Halomonas campaniensis TaxID=213554 RepID=A0A246S3W3_9GAMM|nr:hypothetical protein [Halomonas campaniensis]OWV31154.1 hypothetical protein JI62_02685 [Halomonas campaniensis]
MTAKNFEQAPGKASRPLRVITPSGETFILGKTSNPEKEQDIEALLQARRKAHQRAREVIFKHRRELLDKL